MKKNIIYSYITDPLNTRECDVYLLVPLDQFKTSRKPCNVPRTSLEGIGKYGYKIYSSYGIFKVPGKYKKFPPNFPQQGIIVTKKLSKFVEKEFTRIMKDPLSSDILYGYIGTGESVITSATIYALVPKSEWVPKNRDYIKNIPRDIKIFHGYSLPDLEDLEQRYYIFIIPEITECTALELYSEDLGKILRFEQTLTKI